MTYQDFIRELRELVRTGEEISSETDPSHEDPAFRSWKHTAESIVADMQRRGITLPGPFQSNLRHYHALWANPGRLEHIARFRRDMTDSLIEMNYLIDHFERYGEPLDRTNTGSAVTSTLDTEKVTIAWLGKHVPVTLWLSAVAVCAVIFAIGYLAGKNSFVQKSESLIRETFMEGEKKQ